jgi:hypothetical protein
MLRTSTFWKTGPTWINARPLVTSTFSHRYFGIGSENDACMPDASMPAYQLREALRHLLANVHGSCRVSEH